MNEGLDEAGRYAAVMRQCRALERHAASLRGELLWLAGGQGERGRVERALGKLHEQLRQVQSLADDFQGARASSARDAA